MNLITLTLRLLVVAACLNLLNAGVVAAKAPEFPVPDDARVAPIGQNMRVNGSVISARHFSSRESTEEIIDFYREEWGKKARRDPAFTVTNVHAPWTIISRIEDGYLMTVQVRATDTGGSEGLLGMSRLSDAKVKHQLGQGFPLMGGSKVINEVISQDVGQSGRTMIVGNKHDIRTNVDFYRGRYETEGWTFDMDRSIGGMAHVLALRKGRKRVNLVLREAAKGGTQIVVNEVTHNLL
ncbi:MAG: hypothetical protein E2O36_00835 [Proteobacteria bacterium]|nr:MAG: hypothetical protein E2O36_00835 [Pseudomonadota bacterium]